MSLICLAITIVLIFRKQCRKLKSNSTKILVLIMFSLICKILGILVYFIYNLKRIHRTYYFLEELIFQVYQACLIFYFGKKLVVGSTQRKNYNIIRIIFVVLIILDITTFIMSVIEAISKQMMCKQISFTVFRSVSLLTQIGFLAVVQKLNKRFQQNIQNLLINEQQTKQQKSHFFQLKILCYISLFGSVILLIVNFLYMISSDCRIISHFGDEGYNFSDSLNAFIHALVKLFTYFLPIILTLILFRTKSKKEIRRNSVFEAEDLSYQSYFQGLSLQR
ncbi:unnamed protein product (macronuclear) [Paramecium tetraurelia]|uniref:THH1/TOM1/TOM3 domain-containing protein n=1 Tax=Paramecium tetraurelia TaxID=5888 RepID=A0CH50_PARTE|nr:uncharacterized protein GSPATT00007557001 [Paramecium tetraurelia]CAK70117.1 unnamed protein product [Paramecium tetraurelia]|eukprot:XP_001437514.1 hypothetical protein (macronuclear) [Paramecium tetraurelia strain d4-2]